MHTTFSIQSMFVIFFFYIYSSSISTQITHLVSSQFINGFSCCKRWPCCIYTMTGSGCQSVLLLPPRKGILLYFMSISDTICEVCPLSCPSWDKIFHTWRSWIELLSRVLGSWREHPIPYGCFLQGDRASRRFAPSRLTRAHPWAVWGICLLQASLHVEIKASPSVNLKCGWSKKCEAALLLGNHLPCRQVSSPTPLPSTLIFPWLSPAETQIMEGSSTAGRLSTHQCNEHKQI